MRLRLAICLLASAASLAMADAARAQGAPQNLAAAAPAVETVRVRAGQHADRSRLVFDFARPVDYSFDQTGGEIRLVFGRQARADISGLERARLRTVEGVIQSDANGRLEVRIRVPEATSARHFRSGNSIALDVIDAPRAAEAARAQERPAASAAARTEHPPVQAQRPASQAAAPAAEPRKAEAPLREPAEAEAVRADESKPGAARQDSPAAEAPKAVAPRTDQASPTPARSEQPRAVQAQATPAAPAQAAPAQAAPAQAVQAAPAPPAAERRRSLSVDPRQPASAAVFVRGSRLFVVFDRPLPPDAIRVEPADMTRPEPLAVASGGGFHLPMPQDLVPRVEREGSVWRIHLEAPGAGPAEGLPVISEPDFLLGPRVLVRAGQAASPIAVPDPAVGDRLMVVPLAEAGRAVTRGHGFVQARILPAEQGIVVRPLDDALQVRAVRDGVELTAAGGMVLSSISDIRLAAPPPEAAPAQEPGPAGQRRLLDVAAWKRGASDEFNRLRQSLQQAVIQAPEGERLRRRLDLARFYFSHAYGPEALGMLGMILQAQPELEDQPEFRAVRGASAALAGDFGAARADLAIPALDGNPEVKLWRAVTEAGLDDWQAAARDFLAGRAALDEYPDEPFKKLSLIGAEALAETGSPVEASRALDRLEARIPRAEQNPGVQYLRGRIHAASGRLDDALAIWRELSSSPDAKYRTRAQYALAVAEQETGRVKPEETVARLERLRFAWRGDAFELKVLNRLGEAYLAAGDYPNGIDTLRTALTLFPEDPSAPALAQRVTRAFADLFLKDGAAALAPLDALALYDRYKELAPRGAEGDAIERQLAERLVEIDLLGRAADILEGQVTRRLQGVTKGEVGARLASIRLLDGKPAQAVSALDRSEVPGISEALAGERRVLRARALADERQFDQAMALLAGDASPGAELLRVDVAWRAGHWAEAATALDRIVGPPPSAGTAISRDASQLVVNRAVALALAGDAQGLSKLRQDFGTAMAAGPDADSFRVLTRQGQGGALVDAATIKSRVAEVDVFRKFLSGYRSAAAPRSAAAN
ncbi:tetratricopeptide repeat protein [Arenibaculum pallidiluteum]|uniref:tetratricopeptide repeat protein n=1 Tax=Arenibaculum pallidiluteum TaxID=2812559 RepID=UPI001A96A4E3|nr:tetratricopeptide repeat protein [Arenibaculum pallidiluteum]